MSDAGRPDSYARAWLIIFAAAALALAAWRSTSAWRLGPSAPEALVHGGKTWFLALRMPEIKTDREAGVDTMRRRYDEWLRALRRAGFCPVTLSQARERLLAPGGGLPDRAVVMVFQPGRRRTLAIVEPIFRREGWPATWFTDARAMRKGNRDFVTFHLARRLMASGWWDVAYSRRDGGYDVLSRHDRFTLGGDGRAPWSRIDGTFALNRAAPSAGLETLTVDPNWTPDELVDRLRAELPIERPTCLAKAVIQRREWGVTGERAFGAAACREFSLEAPEARRGTRLYWLGTKRARGRPFQLDVEAASVVGELQVSLLEDEGAGTRLVVGFTEHEIRVSKRRGPEVSRLAVLPRRGRVSARLILADDRLTVSRQAAPDWTSPPLDARGGLVELSLYENVRGEARADGIRLLFDPLAAAPQAEAAR